jgi:hypothetical protein
MQVFPVAKHQIPDQEPTCDCHHQPNSYNDFYSPIHFCRVF